MRETTIDGVPYRIGRLDARKQFHVVRRLAPVLAASAPALQMWASTAAPPTKDATDALRDASERPFDMESAFGAVGPLAKAIGDLSDETSDYVLGTCLSAVTTNRRGSTWAAVVTPGGQLMFEDISMATMLRLVLLVLQENVGDFLADGGGSTTGAR